MAKKGEVLKTNIIQSFGTLIFREFFIKIFSFFGQLLLARLLFPSDFGVYVIIVFIVSFFSLFTDTGLSLAIIQKKEKPSASQLSNVFFLKLILVVIVISIIWFISPFVQLIYPSFSLSHVEMLKVFSLTLFFSSLRLIPTSLLEREIKYNLISIIDIVGVGIYYLVAIALAFSKFGIWSFILAALAKEILETFLLFWVKPFIPQLTFSLTNIKGMMRFGFFVQGNSIVNFLNNSIIPFLGGILIGPLAVGLLDFADTIGSFPENIAVNFGRVAFAGYSKIQRQRDLLFKSISKSVSLLSILLYIFPVLIFCFGAEFIKSFYTENWHFAIPALYWFSAAAFFLPIMASFGQGILSIGKSKEIFRATLITTVIGWILAFVLINKIGFVGIAVSNLVFELTLCIFYISILRSSGFNFPLLTILFPKTVVVLISVFIGFILNNFLPMGIPTFILKVISISLVYLVLMYSLAKDDLLELVRLVSVWRRK